MSDVEPVRVTVRILEKEFNVACPPGERDDLLEAAAYLNAKMKEVRDVGKVVGTDRIAVIAALNMANELVKLQARQERDGAVGVRLKNLRDKVDAALERGKQLEI
ncbi:cell division protein ZapA [bacterium]|nr:MAG: cell division protein ZapA [bacterium]